MREKLKTLIPLEELEDSAMAQVDGVLAHPFVERMALMPDCHTGYDMPIGGVALLNGVISPAYVGYDIGCGMCLFVTHIKVAEDFDVDRRKEVYQRIYEEVPVGFNSHADPQIYREFHPSAPDSQLTQNLYQKVASKMKFQVGTLGGGNHFIELGEDSNGYLAVTIHSGSRNMGHSIASYYMKESKFRDVELPRGFFHLHSEYGQAYLEDMNFALEYALHNRLQIMERVLIILNQLRPDWKENSINENHNHAIRDPFFLGPNYVLHRKGATPAERDKLGVIPGNMRDGVYVTLGLGNEDYLQSASHGAGRRGSRKWARSATTVKQLAKEMAGIISRVDEGVLDEGPHAYKAINVVIDRQKDIVIKVLDHICSLVNIKG